MSEVREEWARVLEIIATEGFPQPRDLDVALDALEGALGIPAATLAGLRDGTLVAVPRETGMDFGASPSRTIAVRMVWKDGLLQQTEIPMEEFLAAAKDVRHD